MTVGCYIYGAFIFFNVEGRWTLSCVYFFIIGRYICLCNRLLLVAPFIGFTISFTFVLCVLCAHHSLAHCLTTLSPSSITLVKQKLRRRCRIFVNERFCYARQNYTLECSTLNHLKVPWKHVRLVHCESCKNQGGVTWAISISNHRVIERLQAIHFESVKSW